MQQAELDRSMVFANEDVYTSQNRYSQYEQLPVVSAPLPEPAPAEPENLKSAEPQDLLKSSNSRVDALVQPWPVQRPQPRFIPLQQFEGTVEETTDDGFVARLRDQTSPSEPEQRATIDLMQIWESDHELVVPGAVFYWSIGYRVEPKGQRSLTSTIRFRRLPAWTARDVERVSVEAAELDDFFSRSP